MRQILTVLALIAAAAAPSFAQEATAPAEAPATAEAPAETTPGPEAGGLSMGETVAAENGLGAPYVKEEHGDWQIRCIRTNNPSDPCQLYQLLKDDEGNSIAEFAIFPLLPPQGDAIAGGTIITPLETLLTQAVTMVVDGGEPRRYPFTFCTQVGCFARLGYAAADVERFKRGAKASVSIVPVLAPDQRITLNLSLSGFTAGYDALDKLMKEQAAAAPAPEAAPAEAAPADAAPATTTP